MTTTNSEPAVDDLDAPLWGAGPISEEIKRTKNQTYHMLEQGLIPATKVGRQWVSTKLDWTYR